MLVPRGLGAETLWRKNKKQKHRLKKQTNKKKANKNIDYVKKVRLTRLIELVKGMKAAGTSKREHWASGVCVAVLEDQNIAWLAYKTGRLGQRRLQISCYSHLQVFWCWFRDSAEQLYQLSNYSPLGNNIFSPLFAALLPALNRCFRWLDLEGGQNQDSLSGRSQHLAKGVVPAERWHHKGLTFPKKWSELYWSEGWRFSQCCKRILSQLIPLHFLAKSLVQIWKAQYPFYFESVPESENHLAPLKKKKKKLEQKCWFQSKFKLLYSLKKENHFGMS